MRAFLNKKIDLAQAEAVEMLISSRTAAMHRAAINQMRGGYSAKINELRGQLLDFASLVELELDFSEEDVEFADRAKMLMLIEQIIEVTEKLIASFSAGNAIKQGIPAAICGKPNAGKSTLFNALLCEERTIVSPIAGTTRDAIEAQVVIGGTLFRFIDTAGLHTSTDILENMAIERSYQKIAQASIILWIADCTESAAAIAKDASEFLTDTAKTNILLLNKTDLLPANEVDAKIHTLQTTISGIEIMPISSKNGDGIELLQRRLAHFAVLPDGCDDGCIVTNVRHYQALSQARDSLMAARSAILGGISGDVVAFELHDATRSLAEITGEITSDEILNNIFGRFCIGK